MEFNPGERRKRLKVWISEEERALLDAKASFYGYNSLSAYIRYASIYEKVTYVDLKNREELYNDLSNYAEELKSIGKDVRHICTFATQLPKDEVIKILHILHGIYRKQKEILNLIEKKLDLDVWYEINH